MKFKALLITFMVTIILSLVTSAEMDNTSIFVSGSDTGGITSLKTDKASYPISGETVTVTSSVNSVRGIVNSHIYYSIIDDGTGQVYTTHYTTVTGIPEGGSYTDSWTISNTGFPTSGRYTLRAEWRQGDGNYGSGDLIDSKTITFYSVPSPWFIVGVAAFLIAIAYLARVRRWWLSFYLAGSLSVLLLIVAFFSLTGLDNYLMAIEAQNMAFVATVFGLPTSYLPPNAFIFPDPSGWVVFGIGFECSSLIELGVLVGLLFFYPGYNVLCRVIYILLGVAVIYVANIIRMLTVAYVVHILGNQYVYIAHTLVGKLLFFAFVVTLFWYLLTKPTLKIVKTNIKKGRF